MSLMIRIFRLVLLVIHFIVSCTLGILYGLLRPFHPTNSRWCAQTFAFFGLPIIGIRLKISGKENYPSDRPFIVVSNHQSNWDLFVVGASVPKRTVSLGKKNLKWIPFFGQLYWLSGNVLIDRGNPEKAMEAMAITRRALVEKQTNIWFFAEGTRNRGKNMLPFKKGAFVTAINAGVPIIPVCCSAYLSNFDLNNMSNGDAKITVLPAIETQGMSLEDLDELMLKVRLKMMETITSLDAEIADSALR